MLLEDGISNSDRSASCRVLEQMGLRTHWLWVAGYFLLLCAPAVFAMQAAEAPASLRGTWKVIQVAVDANDQPHWLYEPNDPRLLGRELEISGSEISLDDNSRTCMKPVWEASGKIALHALIGKSFKRPPHFGTAPYPSLSDFGLTLKDALVTQRRVMCSGRHRLGSGLVRLCDARHLADKLRHWRCSGAATPVKRERGPAILLLCKGAGSLRANHL